jgi:putative peptidoglycan lipid II flippase
MSLATLLSRILGMARDMLMAAFFPRMVSDAFVVAFRLPNLFRRVLGEGSLAASFVPLYIGSLSAGSPAGKGYASQYTASGYASQYSASRYASQQSVSGNAHQQSEAQKFSSAIFSMLTVLTATLSVLGIIFMNEIVSWLVNGEGYMSIAGKYELTVILARIMFGYLFLVTTYAFLMSVANAHKVFFLPALAPAGFNIVTIIMILMPQFKTAGDQMAWGVLIGGVLQLLMAAQPLWQLKMLPRWTLNWNVKNVSPFFRNVIPSMLGMSVAQLLGVLNVHFASHLKQGSHTYIYFADRLVEFPQSLLSVSLGVALLPTLSELWVNGEKSKFLETAQRHIRLLSTLSLPAAIGLWVLSEPIIKVIYGRGEFLADDISATAQVLSIYAIILIVTGLHRVTVPCFYAIKNTWLPAVNSAFCILIHYFVAGWATERFGLNGLVGATAFTGALNLGLLLLSYKIIFGELGAWSFAKSVLWLTPALGVMGLVARLSYSAFAASSNLEALIALTVSILLSVIAFFGVSYVSRHPEANEIRQMLFRRFRKRASRA